MGVRSARKKSQWLFFSEERAAAQEDREAPHHSATLSASGIISAARK